MKALCDREQLLEAFGMVGGVIPARSPKPILQNVKLVADGEAGSTLLATDLEVGIRCRVLGMKVDKAGAAILPAGRMNQILRVGTDQELAIETDDNHLIIRGLHEEFRLSAEDPALYPEVPDFNATSYHVVSAGDLKRLIKRTIFATEVESTRYALGGVLFELGPESITLVGTDGRRLAQARAVAETEGNPSIPPGTPVVPVKALKLIERNLNDDDPPVHIAFVGNTGNATAVLVRTERAVIHSRLVEGRFPRYQDVFPTTVDVRIPMEAGTLRVAVEKASIVTNDETRGVDFRFADGFLKLSSEAADIGKAHVELPIKHDGKAVEITFDARYLAEALRALDDNTPITAELIDHKSAAVFRTEDQYAYVVMPLTRER